MRNAKTRSRKPAVKPEITHHFKHRLREGTVILVLAISLFMFIALTTFHRSDPGWSQTGMSSYVLNSGGRAGAFFADFVLYLFGYLAYLFPLMVGYSAWLLFSARRVEKHQLDYRLIALRSFGFLLVVLSGCALSSLHFLSANAHLPFQAGGILGAVIDPILVQSFNLLGTTLLLLSCFFAGVTLATGLSWLKVIDLTGKLCWEFGLWLIDSYWWCADWFAEWQVARAAKLKKQALKSRLKPAKTKGEKKKTPPTIDAPVARLKQSVRAQKDKQIPLFDIPVPGTFPSISLLDRPEPQVHGYSKAQLEVLSREVEIKLADFGVSVEVVAVHPGPVITRFDLQLAPGVKVARLVNLVKDIARSLSMISVRIVEVIPGKSVVGLELPNEERAAVRLSEVIASEAYEQARSPLSLALGKDIAGNPVVVDLAKMPHLLVAGTTGSGKSVGLNAMLLSLLYKSSPDQVRLILIDPKMLELAVYDGIEHLLTPVVTDMKDAANALRWCVAEMERRYKLMAALGVRNLSGFNTKVREGIKKESPIKDPLWKPEGLEMEVHPELTILPFIVVLVDEFADMMMVVGKKVEELIARIAQKARAAGIHLILATQRPSVDVITGLIKANVPTRIAFQVSSKIDSRTILDQGGAEQLLGMGDMLYLPPGTGVPVRVHGAFVDDHEVHQVVNDLRKRGTPNYIESIIEDHESESTSPELGAGAEEDPLYDQAVQIVTESRRASISNVQRRLKIGYNRAARLIEGMEAAGVVSTMESNGSREVLAPPPA